MYFQILKSVRGFTRLRIWTMADSHHHDDKVLILQMVGNFLTEKLHLSQGLSSM